MDSPTDHNPRTIHLVHNPTAIFLNYNTNAS